MPEVNGIDVLRELKRRRISTRVLMVSRLTAAGAQVTTDALIEGAFDFVLKPSGSRPSENKAALRSSLETRIAALRESQPDAARVAAVPLECAAPRTSIEAVVIGCSTGGPDALSRIIPELSGTFPVPILIVQHMPDGFTATLARRLNEASELEVFEAAEGLKVKPGQVAIARGGRHLQIARRLGDAVVLAFSDLPPEHGCRPAVDVTLRSAVEHFPGHLLTVILTGMGRDGLAGCELNKSHGGHVLAQHADGCTVYGMPKAVIQAGLADHVTPLGLIPKSMERLVRQNRPAR